jgi:hypothetical protein
MNPFCANEEHYHQIVIKNMDGFPNIGKPNAKLRSFVWGHEMDLHDAGRGGGNGSADLLIVDEEGMVWLAEAKFDFTTERGPVVWGSRVRTH